MSDHSAVIEHAAVINRSARRVFRERTVVRLYYRAPEDASQQAFLYCLHYGLRYYDGGKAMPTYFGVLARRGVWDGCAKHLRRVRRDNHPTLEVQVDEPLEVPQYADDDLWRRLLQTDMLTALGVLTPRERDVLVLRYGLDGSCRQLEAPAIGAALGIAPCTAKTLLARGLARLRTHLKLEDWCG